MPVDRARGRRAKTATARFGAWVILATLLTQASSQPAFAQAPTTVADDLAFPVGLAFLPNGDLVFSEKQGTIRIIEDGKLRTEPLAAIPTVSASETGLLDVALPSDAGADPAVYVFATDPDGTTNSVWRVPLDGSLPTRIIEGLPAGTYHNGGGLAFGTDGSLYVTNGEQHETNRAQDPEAMGGKVYRYEPDGSVPTDNPYGAVPTYAMGLRNPFGIALDPISGDLWVTENGPGGDDEVNRIVPQGNYGWPEVVGSGCDEECIDPVLTYGSTIVPTGIAFPASNAPSRLDDTFFFAAYGESTVHQVTLDDSRTEAIADDVLLRSTEPVIGLEWGPGGLYFTTPTSIQKIAFENDPDDSSGGGPSSQASPSPTTTEDGEAVSEDAGRPWGLLILAVLVGGLVMMRTRLNEQTRKDSARDES
jgi:aldose sugar dehydrogenase